MANSQSPVVEQEFIFGAFRFIPVRHLLLYGEEPVRVGSRALDILAILLERPGELVTKRELITRVWPASVVEDSNLKVHMAALRRALGDAERERRFIVTVNGRGYCFVHQLETKATQAVPPVTCNLPVALTRPIGREAIVATLVHDLPQQRLLTVVGPGGIGKTTVALATAEAFSAQTGADVCFVDLGRVLESRFVVGTLATALGLTIHSGDPVQAVLTLLRTQSRLIVLDSCENVIDEAATLAARMLLEAPETVLLATSREPMRIPGEHVHQLDPLAFPGESTPLTAAQALEYAAVQLFVERAAESRAEFRLSDVDASAVAEICRRLEGIALAIELAATRIDAFSATELAARLDDRFRLLKRGRRGALLRHQTLDAALDWSYAYLTIEEQAILRGLAVFAHGFGMDTAIALLSTEKRDATAIIDGVGDLVAKSLVVADLSGLAVRYRLLDTTRAYALDKLEQHGETIDLRTRHANITLARLQDGQISGFSADDTHLLLDLREALDWTFGAGADVRTGIALTVKAIPLWMRLSLVDECRRASTRALAAGADSPYLARVDAMRLQAALAGATLHTCGPVPECGDAWLAALEFAEELEDDEYLLRSLWGLAMYRGYVGEFQSVLTLADRFRAVAEHTEDSAAKASVERLIGTAYHSLGEEPSARRHLELMLSKQPMASSGGVQFARFQIDQGIAALSVLGNVLWVLGYPLRARRTMQEAVRNARASGHVLSLVGALANAACLAVRSRDAEANALLEELGQLLTRNAIAVMDTMRRSLRGLLDLQTGKLDGAAAVLQGLEEMRASRFQYRYSIYMGMLAEALGRQGREAEGLVLIDTALDFANLRGEGWCTAELWRIKGELVDDATAVDCYARGIEIAHGQQARQWSLRLAAGLVRRNARRGHAGEALSVLAAIFSDFDEGFDTADLLDAQQLLTAAGLSTRGSLSQ